MKITLEIPKEFEVDFYSNHFEDFFERVKVDLESKGDVRLCGNYEKEIVDMMETSFQNAVVLEQERTEEEDLGR